MKIFIETERLILRELVAEDIHGMFALDSDPEVMKYILVEPHTKIEQSVAVIEMVRKQYEENGIGRWAVVLKDTNEFIGWGGLKLVKTKINGHTDFYDLGYRLLRKHWGKGYATEISIAMLDYGFNKMNLQDICAYALQEHTNSRKVLEKVGLKFIENFEEDGVKDAWYKITREEYLKQYPLTH